MRRTIRSFGWIGLASILVGMATSAAAIARVHSEDPRNEAAFLHDAHRYTRSDGGLQAYDRYVVMTDPSDAQLINAGDRVCQWLGGQPPALFVTSYQFSPRRLADVYWKANQGREWALPRQVYTDAWEHLCPATLYLVKPHFVFTDPHD